MTSALPKPTRRAPRKPKPLARRTPLGRGTARIRTQRPLGTVRLEAKAAGYVDPLAWEAVLDFHRDPTGVIRCAYCLTARATEADHVVPVAKGGADTVRNLSPICSACNQEKGQLRREPALRHPWLAPVEAV